MPNTGVFKDTGYHQLCIAGLLCFACGVPTNHEAKYFIISHFSCHVCLNINDLAQLECKKLQCVFLTSIIAIRLLYDASGIVTRLLGQLKFNPGLVSQELQPALRAKLRRLCIDDINIDDIRSGWVLSVPDK